MTRSVRNHTVSALLVLLMTLLGAPTSSALTAEDDPPDWSRLDCYQNTILREAFVSVLDNRMAPNGAWHPFIEVEETFALIRMRNDKPNEAYVLRFAGKGKRASIDDCRYWSGTELARSENTTSAPLAGLEIALDPGHIGGKWAVMEGRSFSLNGDPAVQEGDLVLEVAQIAQRMLERLGASATLVRTASHPTTALRPADLLPVARKKLGEAADAQRLRKYSELLFYRVAEIQARAKKVNEQIKPDLVVCLHINAAPWQEGPSLDLSEENHLHVLVNGAYSEAELAREDQRLAMLEKLLSGAVSHEERLARSMAAAFRDATDLPPFTYTGPNAAPVDADGYVWARNLLANRLYECPVVYLEPYVANSRPVYSRLSTSEGRQAFLIEYARAIVEGLLHFRASAKATDVSAMLHPEDGQSQ